METIKKTKEDTEKLKRDNMEYINKISQLTNEIDMIKSKGEKLN